MTSESSSTQTHSLCTHTCFMSVSLLMSVRRNLPFVQTYVTVIQDVYIIYSLSKSNRRKLLWNFIFLKANTTILYHLQSTQRKITNHQKPKTFKTTLKRTQQITNTFSQTKQYWKQLYTKYCIILNWFILITH